MGNYLTSGYFFNVQCNLYERYRENWEVSNTVNTDCIVIQLGL